MQKLFGVKVSGVFTGEHESHASSVRVVWCKSFLMNKFSHEKVLWLQRFLVKHISVAKMLPLG